MKWLRRRLLGAIVIVCLFSPMTRAALAGVPPEIVPLVEGFENGLGLSLILFETSNSCGSAACDWSPVNTQKISGTFSAYVDDLPQAYESQLYFRGTLAIPADATAATLTFWNLFDYDYIGTFNYDGGVLEASTDGGMTWLDAGANITANGYNGTIESSVNPLAGRAGWVNTSPAGWAQVTVDVLPYRDSSFTFRWVLGTNAGNASFPGGWWIDDVRVSYQAPSTVCGRSWSTVARYPDAIDQVAVASVNDTLYAFGGRTNAAIANAYRYSAENNLWVPIASLPEPRCGASAVSDGTYIYILGGAREDAPSATLWRYDPVDNRYDTLSPYITATTLQAAAVLDDSIYRIGGETDPSDGTATDTVEVYSIANNSWAPAANLPESLAGLTALTLDGGVYVAGGSNPMAASKKTYRYDRNGNSWDDDAIADLPGPHSRLAGAFYNGTWIVFGAIVLGWDPDANSWQSLDAMPQLLSNIGVGVAGGALHTVGGALLEVSAVVQRYAERNCQSPPPTTPVSPTDTPTPPPGSSPTATRTGTQPGPSPTPGACHGDCDGDARVTIADLVRGVAIALNRQPVAACATLDTDHDGTVRVNELVAAVNDALRGCSAG